MSHFVQLPTYDGQELLVRPELVHAIMSVKGVDSECVIWLGEARGSDGETCFNIMQSASETAAMVEVACSG